MTGTLTNKTGYATALPDTIAPAWDSFIGYWQWEASLAESGDTPSNLAIQCNGSSPAAFQLVSGAGATGPSFPINADPGATCSEMMWTVGAAMCGPDGYTLIVTP